MGVTKQAAHQRFTAGSDGALSRSASEVLTRAEAEALDLGHNYVGTEHILLALALAEESTAGRVLHHVGVSAGAIIGQAKEMIGCNQNPRAQRPLPPLPWTPRARRVVREAARLARNRGDRDIGTPHLLLAIVQQRDNLSVKILRGLGVRAKRVREETIRSLSTPEECAT